DEIINKKLRATLAELSLPILTQLVDSPVPLLGILLSFAPLM
ncbi:unnamed protein product, partial [marine sediment metagenome]